MKLRVMLFDDEPTSIETLIEELEKEIEAKTYQITDFDSVESALVDFLPDIVIIDIFRGGATPDGDFAGLTPYRFIWDTCFCPIVVYSAQPDIVSDQIPEHPFVRLVQKGMDSESKVISCIKEFAPHVEALNIVQNDIRQHVNRELKNIAPLVFSKITNVEKRKAIFVRAARRRIAAMMDQPSDEPIACWEQYLYPPFGSNLLSGDVIRKKKGAAGNPEDYLIVLTPSCDLVRTGSRTPNVAKVLVACCTDIENSLREEGINSTTGEERFKERLLPLLRRGYGKFCLPFPELPEILPPMTVELKKLELIDINLIGDDEACEYCRVASVDSPFREMITWAYLQVTGRPGLPDRDFDDWADHIFRTVSQDDQGGDA